MDPREGMGVREKDVADEPEPTIVGNVASYPTYQPHIVHASASEFRALDWERANGKIVGAPRDRRDLQVFCQKMVLASKLSGNGHQLQVSMLTFVRLCTYTNVYGGSKT
jgi:hypothetical protein